MKIYFFARHYSYLRMFESSIARLAECGHDVVLAADREETLGGRAMLERLARRFPNIQLTAAPQRRAGAWSDVARQLRLGIDYLRFLQPMYASTPHLRARVRERAPRVIVRCAESRLARVIGGVRGVGAFLRFVERGLPGSAEAEAYLRVAAPDLLMITPLVDVGSPQLDYLSAARKLGIRTALPVGSWDHLSSKSLLREVPDRVIVWNDAQRSEAIDMHGVPPERVVVTGAQCYDQWFDRGASRSRADFCARVGLRDDRPFIVYVCSSLFRGTAHEPSFVADWVRAIRASADPRLKDVGILIRPHPARLDEWHGTDLSGYDNLTFWGAHPVDDEAKDDYFDSMHHSAAVVGLNTSAFIEAAVVGTPVHTVLLPEISGNNQEGTLHFRYLLEVGGGLLHVARSLDEHLRLLADSCVATQRPDSKAERFVAGFVRPLGRDVAATPVFVAAVEHAAVMVAPAPDTGRVLTSVARVLLWPLAAALLLGSDTLRSRTKKRVRQYFEASRAAKPRREKPRSSAVPRRASDGDTVRRVQ